MSILPEEIMVCRVAYNWYQVIKAHFVLSGSQSVNCWYNREFSELVTAKNPKAGTMALFVLSRGKEDYIVGGGFYYYSADISVNKAWNIFGVRNGCMTIESFRRNLEAQGIPLGQNLGSHVISGTFMFYNKEQLLVPEECEIDLKKQVSFISVNEPLGRYLTKIVFHQRRSQLQQDSVKNDWPGIYLMATRNHSIEFTSVFYARMLEAYDFKCAVTQSTTLATLDVAHIRTFYDEKYQRPDNGIVLRCDLHRMFTNGFMTAVYVSPDEVRLKVSPVLADLGGSEYMVLNGAKLYLPKDLSLWPNPEYLKWHDEVRYENWLKFGEIKPVDVTKSA